MRIANTKRMQKMQKKRILSTSASLFSKEQAGTVSSMVFTPIQGLELVIKRSLFNK